MKQHAQLRIFPDPILGTPCQEITEFGDNTKELKDLLITNQKRFKGVGLAAPQIGLSLRAFSATVAGADRVFFNPVIMETSGAVRSREGCLSLPGIIEELDRCEKITISYQDEDGNPHTESFDGRDSIIIQHELHHLLGVLFCDLLSKTKQNIIKRKMNKLPVKMAKRYLNAYLTSRSKAKR